MQLSRERVFWLAVLVMASLFLLPSLLRLPEYWPELAGWRPMSVAQTVKLLLAPQGQTEKMVRQAWGWSQFFVLALAVLILAPSARVKISEEGIPEADKSGAHGTARWRSQGELTKALQRWRIGGKAPPVGAILAGVDRSERPQDSYFVAGLRRESPVNPHVLVLGASGSGKSRRLALPTLWTMGLAKKNSIVVTDPKGELYSLTSAYFRQQGYAVRTLNLIDPRRSDMFNPLHEIARAWQQDRSRASELAWNLAHAMVHTEDAQSGAKDPFWDNSAEALIAALVLYTVSEEREKTVGRAYELLINSRGDELDELFQGLPDTHPAYRAFGTVGQSGGNTRLSITSTAASKLRLFSDPVVERMTAGQDYEFVSIGETPTIVYLLLPDDNSTRNSIAAQYITQAYGALRDLARKSPGGRLPIPVFWILDEFANLGKFKDFEKMISVMRGSGMGVMIILQALQQLHAVYEREVGEIIAANCDSWLLLSTNDLDTAEAISKKLGEFTYRSHSAGANLGSQMLAKPSYSTNEQLQGRALLTPDEVLRWPRGQSLLLQVGQQPAKLALADISQWPAKFQEAGAPPVRVDPTPAKEPPAAPKREPLAEPAPVGGTTYDFSADLEIDFGPNLQGGRPTYHAVDSK